MAHQHPRRTKSLARRTVAHTVVLGIPKQASNARLLSPLQERALLNFAKKTRKSSRIRALFSGPSGTGKTLAAQFLAQKLKTRLYDIDVGAVIKKYIGETKKNLHRLIDNAEASGAILYFDEADPLFGKRTQVTDRRERYASRATEYLCACLLNFQGLIILATRRRVPDSLLKIECHLWFPRSSAPGFGPTA
jgi:SpoVK/Ycf46/Vps4 family AAA+-type ATPase